MEVSVETLTGLERRLTIQLPIEPIDADYTQRLVEMAKTAKINGFRPGKVPVKEIKKRHGKAVRMEILNEVMRTGFIDAVSQEDISPVGMPHFKLESDETGKPFSFIADFEIYPEVEVQPLGSIKVEKLVAEINEEDIDKVIENVRQQHSEWEDLDKAAENGDQVLIDFEGKIDGESFEGGSATDTPLTLGSGQMIAGFESGLEGSKADDVKELSLKFPDDYHSADVADKDVLFKVTVHKVQGKKLPELDDAFVEKLGVKGGISVFRDEVRKNMEMEKEQAEKKSIKDQVFKNLAQLNTVELPKAMVKNEVERLQQQMFQQFGGGQQFDPSMLPADLFTERAEESAKVGLLVSEIIKANDLKADGDKVRETVEELASRYGEPEQVVNWYYSNTDKLAEIESMVLEDTVIAHILDKADVTEKTVSYEELFKAPEEEESKEAVVAE
ncbi:MAG: trigger factor [Pseudomonadales bacterium]|nr:trigger factor [Pseudomonadales bacterium]